jgi:hypothetical protein
MDILPGINTNASLVGILSNQGIAPSSDLLASQLSLSTPGLFAYSSTYVGISARGQLLSATVAFQDRLNALQPGTATSGGGVNFGTDFASLAAETQSFVDSFNALQRSIVSINSSNGLPPTGITGATDLVQSLNAQAGATFTNGASSLTALSQLGITLQPALVPGSAASLSLDLDQLEAAFDQDAAGAFSLLGRATDAFSELAAGFISRSGSQYASLDALVQSSLGFGLLSGTPQVQDNSALFSLLASQSQDGNTHWGRVYAAISEYTLVSNLFA